MSSNKPQRLKLTETDEINTPTKTYIYTSSNARERDGDVSGRLDLIVRIQLEVYHSAATDRDETGRLRITNLVPRLYTRVPS